MSPALSTVKDFLTAEQHRIPTNVKERCNRGRAEMLRDANKRRLCMRFERGETYWWLNERNQLLWQSTITYVGGGGKAPHRIRNQYNFIRPIVDGKVSAATTRIPGYQVLPTGTDPERASAAKLSERVARYGYDKWNLRELSIDVIKLALAGGGEGFAMPYFDPNVGPYTPVKDPETDKLHMIGRGEIKNKIFNGNEVYWEPKVKFEESKWWATEQAVPIDVVVENPSYIGGKLVPDAVSSETPADKNDTSNLVMVVEYYERPSPGIPNGRKLTIANGRQIYPREEYPLRTAPSRDYPLGQVLDEPVIHRLVYTHDPDRKRDLGLVWQLIDFQRTAQDSWNKIIEWKNRTLNPRMKAPIGSLIKQPDDEPGGIDWYKPTGSLAPEWERPIPMPPELMLIKNAVLEDMRSISADENFDASPDVAAKTVQAVLETSRARWAHFIGDIAEFHSRYMRHCLLLVSRHYTEERTLAVTDPRFGAYSIDSFRGAQLMDQQDVIVLASSMQVMSREDQEQRIFAFADRQWITPEAAMTAINGGMAEKLIESYELDLSRINRVIRHIRDNTIEKLAPHIQTDPTTGQAIMDPTDGQPLMVPGYMPDVQDNPHIWRAQISDYMKMEEFDRLDQGMQTVCRQILSGVQMLEAQEQQRAADAQAAEAAKLGMGNASNPTRAQPPSPRGVGGSNNPNPNQGPGNK